MTYSHAVGVHNTRPTVEGDASLADLRNRFRRPVVVSMTPAQHRSASKRERSDVKKALPYFVGGEVRGTRKDANVRARTMLTLDVEAGPDQDEQPPAPEATFDALEALGAEGWVYTTLSHTADAPRYRVVLPLDEPITDAATLEATTRAAAKRLGLSEWVKPESWVLSQPMYLPAKLRGGPFYEAYTDGEATAPSAAPSKPTSDRSIPTAADGWEHKTDPVLAALRKVGHYKAPGKEFGQHFILCPWQEKHADENETKTEYREAHTGGYARPACKCMSTSHEALTHAKLVRWLREEHGFQLDSTASDEDPEQWWDSAGIQRFIGQTPEPFEFAVDKLLPLGRVTVLGGPGGVSKSSLALRIMLGVAVGQSWGPFVVPAAGRVLYLSYEDDEHAIHNRLHSMHEAMGADALLYEDAAKNLRVKAVASDPLAWLLVQREERYGPPQPTDRIQWLIDLLKRKRVRLLVIDPVAYTHHAEESDPGAMAIYMQTVGRVARESGAAVLLIHHVHKTAQWATLDDVNAGSLRGASSIADNARSVAVMVSLGQRDAALFGLPADPDTPATYAVLKHVKHNFSGSMGVHVFRRVGPLLEPLDLVRKTREQLAEERDRAKEAQRADRADLKRHTKAMEVLEYLHHNKKSASKSDIDRAVFNKHGDQVGAVEWLAGQGYVTVTVQGLGKASLHRITPAGVEYFLQ